MIWAPDACTMPTAGRPLRQAEFYDLFATARGWDRRSPTHLRVLLDGAPAVEAATRDLAGRESQCCGFFDFGIERGVDGLLRFDIRVPPEQVEVLDAMTTLAELAERGVRP